MWRRSYLGPFVLCVLGIALSIGLFQIFRVRLTSGEYYPAWSSLKSDPDGTRVLFDSLAATGRIETVRRYRGLGLEPERNATVLFLGFAPASLVRASDDDLDEFEKAARSGNRLVIALDAGRWFSPPKEEPAGALAKRWGVGVDRIPGSDDTIALFFNRAAGWTKDAAAGGRLVIAERAFGSGSIVLCASSDAFANRSLAIDRDSSLLVRAIGTNARVVFDESHLGVQSTGSVLGLVHKYRLDGALWGLIALAIVFVWGHATGFPPPDAAVARTTIGHDARGGLAQLLRRQIPAPRIVEACVFEWERSNAGSRLPKPQPNDDPVAAYRALQQELTHK